MAVLHAIPDHVGHEFRVSVAHRFRIIETGCLHAALIWVSISRLIGHSGVLCYPLNLWRERDGASVWETSVQHAGNAWGEGVLARPGILLRLSRFVLKGAGVCVFLQ